MAEAPPPAAGNHARRALTKKALSLSVDSKKFLLVDCARLNAFRNEFKNCRIFLLGVPPPPFRPCLVGIGTSRVLCARVYAKEKKGYEEGNERKRNNEKNRRNGKGCEGERRNHYASVLCSPPPEVYIPASFRIYISHSSSNQIGEKTRRIRSKSCNLKSTGHDYRHPRGSEQHFHDRDGNVIRSNITKFPFSLWTLELIIQFSRIGIAADAYCCVTFGYDC